MTLKELLETDFIRPNDFREFVDTYKLEKITTTQLDTIIEKKGVMIFGIEGFEKIYYIVSTRENNELAEKTNTVMLKLTRITTTTSILGVIIAVISLIVA